MTLSPPSSDATTENRTLVISAGIFPPAINGGGPAKSLAALALGIPETQTHVIASDRDLGSNTPFPQSEYFRAPNVQVTYLNASTPSRLFWGVLKTLHKRRHYTLYINSLFSLPFGLLPLCITLFRLSHPQRVVLAPRGQLLPQALETRSLKKKLALPLITRLVERTVDALHATSAGEADALSLWNTGIPIDLLPNTRIPSTPQMRSPQAGVVTFVGRVVPHKNLHTLISAIKRSRHPITLNIVGPEEDAQYAARCRHLALDIPAHSTIRWLGSQPAHEIDKILSQTAVFAHPSLSENFGHAIAEALQAGCPVIVSSETPWSDAIRSGDPGPGIVLADPTDADELRHSIETLLERDPQTISRAQEVGIRLSNDANPAGQFDAYTQLFFPPK